MQKSMTIRDFAPFLRKAYHRYCICETGTVPYDSDVSASIIATIKFKLNMTRRYDEEDLLSKDVAYQIVNSYRAKLENGKSRNYNKLRMMAWEAATDAAFDGKPMPIPLFLPTSLLSNEFAWRCKETGASFYQAMENAGISRSWNTSGSELMKMAYRHDCSSVRRALLDIYNAHFLPDVPEEKIESHKENNADATTDADSTLDVKQTEKVIADFGKYVSETVNMATSLLRAASRNKTVFTIEEDDLKKILDACGYGNLLDEMHYLADENSELKNRLKELEKLEEEKRTLIAKMKKSIQIQEEIKAVLTKAAEVA